MTIKSDRWIREMSQQHGMIEPFEAGQVRDSDTGKIVSYGTSSYGYDVRHSRSLMCRMRQSCRYQNHAPGRLQTVQSCRAVATSRESSDQTL